MRVRVCDLTLSEVYNARCLQIRKYATRFKNGKFLLVEPQTASWCVVNDETKRLIEKINNVSLESLFLQWNSSRERLCEVLLKLYRLGFLVVDGKTFVLDDLHSSNKSIPFSSLLLKLTSKCNFSCIYCYDYNSRRKNLISSPLYLRSIVEQAFKVSDEYLDILFHGGEPLLEFESIKYVTSLAKELSRATGKKISFSIQTNGSLLTKEIVLFLEKNHFHIGFSVDGDRHLNDRTRITESGKGTYKYFQQNFRKYKDFFLQHGILTTLTSRNIDYIDKIVLHFQKLGFKGWASTYFDRQGRGIFFKELELGPHKIVAAYKKLLDLIKTGVIYQINVRPITNYLENVLLYERKSMCMRSPCGAARDMLAVSSNGDIRACDCVYTRYFMLGNINNNTLEECYNNAQAQNIRGRTVDVMSSCKDCLWRNFCGGTCMGRAILTCGKADGIDQRECIVNSEMFEEIIWSTYEYPLLLDYFRKVSRDNTLEKIV